ncbi:MAG TPA: PF20097 family protein [Thermodesulfobacteriota bacterium]|nr:PF20097 family protein [Thermodesulfobacteriota bacterium]
MYKSKEIILPVIVILLLLITPLWMICTYYGEYSYYDELSKDGIQTGARLDNKEIKTDKSGIFSLFIADSTENYRLTAGYYINTDSYIRCEFGVSKDTFYSIGLRDELLVVYPPSNPTKCTLTDGVEISRYFLLITLIFALFILILGIGFIYYVYKSYAKPTPDKLIKPTTNLGIDANGVICPKCKSNMTEGYMPTVGGVAWRDSDEPIGIPTMFTGLPGTTFWVKRPLLHAFHCKECEIITFKYGKDSNN